MNHYDGPAFYRRYRRPEKSAKEPVSPQFKVPGKRSKQADEEPAIFQRKELRHEETPRREINRRPETRPKPEPKQTVSNDWRSSTPFRPTQVPKQLNRRVIHQPKIDYTALMKQYFQKDDGDVLVFDDGTQVTTDSVMAEQPRLAFETDNSTDTGTATEQPEFNQSTQAPQSTQNDTEVSNHPEPDSEQQTETVQEPLEDSETSVVETPSASDQSESHDSDLTGSSLTTDESENKPQLLEQTEDTNQPVSVTEQQPEVQGVETNPATSQDEADVKSTDDQADVTMAPADTMPEDNVVDSTDDEKQDSIEQSSEPETKPELEHGLGHSLGDILQEENTSSQMNKLALFQDKPTAKPVSENDQGTRGYQFPATSLLTPPVVTDENALDEWIEHQGEVLDETLQAFHVDAHVVDWTVGPTVTQFQVHLALGVKVNKITNLTDDLKLALAAKDIRIEAPIPGKTTVGIEIPNPKTRPVMLSEVLESKAFKDSTSPLTVALGVDLFGQPRVTDLRKMPHGLIAGATGSGKSVFINSLLISLLYKATPAQLRLLLIDPKAVELAPYDGLPHLLSPVISDPQAAAAALKWAVKEMDDRYDRLAAAGVRNIEQYNDRAELTGDYAQKLPYIVIVIDELADLMMMASSEVQDYIVRITQKARAAGIHLLIATQRPSVDIVTGTIKNNIPTRVAFMVSSQVDSRTIIDTSGAERLLGKGDMLFLGNGASQPLRLQGTFVDKEVDRVTDFVRTQGKPHYAFDPDGLLEKQQVQESQDELMPEVLDYIVQEKTVSTSKLQRVFSIGYNRAANLIDTLENKQYISGQNGSKPRDVFLTEKQLAEMRAPRTD
ncbi:cell division protein FtsK [Secundilactobacillus silagincola]|uniref:DNA translocase FtsK n=1 Tax=Secundilactobacillus silagincola TaxID=1714681 RepID=A0A1Z5J1W5_9LACO|nr:DNA translocase FtsK [Secundilactobacillus silagincola]GAX07711.1 cell division protein FtsK [Secundilactobacillus silagincola]